MIAKARVVKSYPEVGENRLDPEACNILNEFVRQNTKKTALETREKLAEYLEMGGSVPWQLAYIRRTGNEE